MERQQLTNSDLEGTKLGRNEPPLILLLPSNPHSTYHWPNSTRSQGTQEPVDVIHRGQLPHMQSPKKNREWIGEGKQEIPSTFIPLFLSFGLSFCWIMEAFYILRWISTLSTWRKCYLVNNLHLHLVDNAFHNIDLFLCFMCSKIFFSFGSVPFIPHLYIWNLGKYSFGVLIF